MSRGFHSLAQHMRAPSLLLMSSICAASIAGAAAARQSRLVATGIVWCWRLSQSCGVWYRNRKWPQYPYAAGAGPVGLSPKTGGVLAAKPVDGKPLAGEKWGKTCLYGITGSTSLVARSMSFASAWYDRHADLVSLWQFIDPYFGLIINVFGKSYHK